ncbi:hypothetical protein Cgig2_023854 [Carnegiea gigantea]|uniref:AIG1-type G domain-containing protein n=1 Tax=Carnegiea gigantea TaxID=171969 RepID=A0A9Q1GHU0_9CARY|nr:hypothetical protein Cgig2_023854 [Carnegiea gigantea]
MQPSGIRPLPSHDDDTADDNSDSESSTEKNSSPKKINKNDDDGKTSTNSSNNSSFNNVINKGKFEDGDDEFGTPLAGPDKETLKSGQNNAPGSGSLTNSPILSSQKVDTPKAKVLTGRNANENQEVDGQDEGTKLVEDEMVGCRGNVEGPALESTNKQSVDSELESANNKNNVEGSELDSKTADEETLRSVVNAMWMEEKQGAEDKESADVDSRTTKIVGTPSTNEESSLRNFTDVYVVESGDATGGKMKQTKDFGMDSMPVDVKEAEERKELGNTRVNVKDSVEESVPSDTKSTAPQNSKNPESDGVKSTVGEGSMMVGMHVDAAEDGDNEPKNDVEPSLHEGHNKGEKEEAELSKSLKTAVQLNKKYIKPENDFASKVYDPTGKLQAVSGRDEKVQPDNLDVEPQDSKTPRSEAKVEAEEDIKNVCHDQGNVSDSNSYGTAANHTHSSCTAQNNPILEESEQDSQETSSLDHSKGSRGEIVTDSKQALDFDKEVEKIESSEFGALTSHLRATAGVASDVGTSSVTSQDGSRLFFTKCPAGLGPPLQSMRATSPSSNSNFLTSPGLASLSAEILSGEERKKLKHIHQLRVKFLRLVYRLGGRAEDSIATQVLYRLALLAGKTHPEYTVDNGKQTAMQLEAEKKDDPDFSMSILVLGKTGVGKSATINSIFGEEKVKIGAFEYGTTSVREISGVVNEVKIRVIDAPGLKCSGLDQGFNSKVLASVKKFTKKYPPNVLLYVDRLDSQSRDLNDVPMLKTITNSLGSSIWRSTVVTLTHASCTPPDGFSYEVFVAQRNRVVHHCIGQAVGDFCLINPSLMNSVALVENHPACQKNQEGQGVLPNGQAWRPQLLLLSYSAKILSEASSILTHDPCYHKKLLTFRARSLPLPYLLSSLLKHHVHPKLSADQGGDNADSDIDLDDLSCSDEEEEYEQLPPFKPLRKHQIAKLSRDQTKAYFEEYDYRVKLFQRMRWRKELKRIREIKKKGKNSVDNYGELSEDFDAENEAPAAIQVPLPDMVLPPSFDSDYPAYRYRVLQPTSQFLVTKDKKEFNIHLDSAVSAKHGENNSSVLGFDIQTISKQLAYIVRGESKFRNLKKNKATAGISLTFLGENLAAGVKLEDQITMNKRLVLVGSTGAVRCQKDVTYGTNLEVRLRDVAYPLGQDESSFVLSLMKWRGDLAVGAHFQSQFSVVRNSKMAIRFSLNNKLSGQLTVRTNTSVHFQFVFVGLLLPFVVSIFRRLRHDDSSNYPIH